MIDVFDDMEKIVGQRLPQRAETADLAQPQPSQVGRASDHDECLQQIGVNHRRQPARDGVDPGRDHQQDCGRHVVPAEDFPRQDPRREQRHRDFRQHVSQKRDCREVPAAARTEALFEKLGHREDAAAQVLRDENPSQQKQAEAGRPLVGADRQAARRARTRQADHVFAANVGGEEGRAHRKPADVLAG